MNRPMLSFRGVGLTDAVEFFHLDSHCTARIGRILGIGVTGAAELFYFLAELSWNCLLLRPFEFPSVFLTSLRCFELN